MDMFLPEEIQTERLRLRRWLPSDLGPFAAMSRDAIMMQYYPSVWSQENSESRMKEICLHFEKHGFGLWAVEIPGIAAFAGFVGLAVASFKGTLHTMCRGRLGIGTEHWNRGYATEGARAALNFGFKKVGLQEIVSFTVPANLPSRRVMEKIGMARNPQDDFDHPALPEGHPLRRHVLYRLSRLQFYAVSR